MGRCVYSPQNISKKCTIFSQKLMLGVTSDGKCKPLRIRELDNDDVDGKPGSTDEDTPPNFSIGL